MAITGIEPRKGDHAMNDNEPRPSQLELPDAPDTDAGPPSLEANAQPTNDPAVAFHNRVAALKQTGDNGANWFYWVASSFI